MPRLCNICCLGVLSCLAPFFARSLHLHTPVVRQQAGLTKVDVLFAADRSMLTGVQVAVVSVVESSHAPARLRLHVVVAKADVETFCAGLGVPLLSKVSGDHPSFHTRMLGGASLSVVEIPSDLEKELHTLFPSGGSRAAIAKRTNTSAEPQLLRDDHPVEYVRWWKPSVFVRLFADDFLPQDSDRAVWLDADVLARWDVAELADTLLAAPSKTIAFARYPGSQEGFVGSYKVEDALSNRSWTASHISPIVLKHPVWNSGVLAFNMERMRTHQLRDRALGWIRLNEHIHLYPDGGSQTPLDLAGLVTKFPDSSAKFNFSNESVQEVDCSWNCWWGFLGQMTETDLLRCRIIHFADKGKPWAPGGERLLGFNHWIAAAKHAKSFFPSMVL